MIRAVMEGVCYSQADSLGVLREMNTDVSSMLVCGGGGKSPLWRQMLADVYGIPCSRIESDEGPALGAAILAMVGVGIYPSVEAACDSVVKLRDTAEPDMVHHEEYGKYYAIYKKLYSHLKDDYAALANL